MRKLEPPGNRDRRVCTGLIHLADRSPPHRAQACCQRPRILFDNRIGGLYHNSQECKNCGRLFYAGTGRWTESGSEQGWIDELRKFYVMIGEGAHIRVKQSRVFVYVSSEARWEELCTPEAVKEHLHNCRQHLKEQYSHYSLRFCSTECLFTYSMMLTDHNQYCEMHATERE